MESTNTTKSNKLLYVDGLNFADEFFQRDGSFWKLNEAQQLVKQFVQAAERSGWKMEVFIDAGMNSSEARQKWVERREADVRTGSLGVPPGIQMILGEMFKA